MSKLAQQLGGQTQAKCYKDGGKVHGDAKQDKKLIAAEFKKRGMKCGGKMKK